MSSIIVDNSVSLLTFLITMLGSDGLGMNTSQLLVALMSCLMAWMRLSVGIEGSEGNTIPTPLAVVNTWLILILRALCLNSCWTMVANWAAGSEEGFLAAMRIVSVGFGEGVSKLVARWRDESLFCWCGCRLSTLEYKAALAIVGVTFSVTFSMIPFEMEFTSSWLVLMMLSIKSNAWWATVFSCLRASMLVVLLLERVALVGRSVIIESIRERCSRTAWMRTFNSESLSSMVGSGW